ncbi:hypothetical protein VNO78_00222 [Psophocarpus tetragonolobus]|uniref:Uncharacterized protein n=1 Tax=Psophocarpus tetragonolobus TaxID=3891 RepID=A0AAN9XTN4_PSOTE
MEKSEGEPSISLKTDRMARTQWAQGHPVETLHVGVGLEAHGFRFPSSFLDPRSSILTHILHCLRLETTTVDTI